MTMAPGVSEQWKCSGYSKSLESKPKKNDQGRRFLMDEEMDQSGAKASAEYAKQMSRLYPIQDLKPQKQKSPQ